MKRIAFLGPEGTVSEESSRYFFSDITVELVPYKLISDVFLATESGETDYSVIPIENTIEGSVSLHMDWIVHEVDLPIQAEWTYPSRQNLIGDVKEIGSDLSKIKKVFSHPVAIAQCKQFLRKNLPDVDFEYMSTAEGVRIVKNNPNQGFAAIGTELACKKYGLNVLSKHIHEHDNNFTRFMLVGKKPLIEIKNTKLIKTSILVTLPEDYPGALHQVLSAFSWRRINLSRIESRPTKKKLGSYYFYIEIEESMETVLLPAAIQEIEAIGCKVRTLGCFPSFSYVND
ncbi:prephenate dehydratase [Chengkuizengella axinellae]|uniref:Prephenate dehydratase n=1 Tax=Chengkuizengella axinellae TaxID=3064388 RepID=A0ABT9IVA9_9BACL|nr:prephenate dehydratase [Chengkuizengella sp. 2205SS18-9]MDP5272745.1 prephenate dehydratase [Chengkuizengella sp. 2205SS18-9]